MYRVFNFPRIINGELQQGMVILGYLPEDTDLDQVLHDLGLKLRMASNNSENIHRDLSLTELLEKITPEMLRPYSIVMIQPDEVEFQKDYAAPIVSRYELEAYQKARDFGYSQYKKTSDAAEWLVRHLELQKAKGHPAISTWTSDKIVWEAVVEAHSYVCEDEPDLDRFFRELLRKAKPDSDNKDQSFTNTANGELESQRTEHIPQ